MRKLIKKVNLNKNLTKKSGEKPALLMVQGTGSDVGKSTLVAALARAFSRRGYRVAPFKPQNMSNNAAAADRGEISRAQAVQAQAAGVAPRVEMNPILLKPQGGMRSQLVVMGKVEGILEADQWRTLKGRYAPVVKAAFADLRRRADIVLVEGAGSPAEINLRPGDIANMGFALMVGAPTILVTDIHRGGSGAAIVGTCAFLTAAERRLLKGYILNRFHGDERLLANLPREIAKRCGLPCLGVMPFAAAAARLPLEDSLALDRRSLGWRDNRESGGKPGADSKIRVVVPRLPTIANFDDLDPLIADPRFEVAFIGDRGSGGIIDKSDGQSLPSCDLLVLCGSKAVRKDLARLRANGWDIDLKAHVRRGRGVIGICGGYQMLGEELADPQGFEGEPGTDKGLGLLPIKTTLHKDKKVGECAATLDGVAVNGYVIHQGVSTRTASAASPFCLAADGEELGVRLGDVAGCYLHGLFNSGRWRDELCRRLRRPIGGISQDHSIEDALEQLAELAEERLDLSRLLEIARDY